MTQSETKLTIAEVEEFISVSEEHQSEHLAWVVKEGLNPEEYPHFCDYYGCQNTSQLARALLASQTALHDAIDRLEGWIHSELDGTKQLESALQELDVLRAALLPQGESRKNHYSEASDEDLKRLLTTYDGRLANIREILRRRGAI